MSTELVYSDACTAASRRASDATERAYPMRVPPSGVDVPVFMQREDDERSGYRKGHFDGQHEVIGRAYGRGGPDPLAAVLREHGTWGSRTLTCGCGADLRNGPTDRIDWNHDAHVADAVRALLFGTEAGR
ncbi:hypothetical protein ACFCZ3_20070 [Cellulosimicrobium cellulans]|uniref:hypothetical protein n=1 Tax=Cellulosimicrobium cellulans TaxID=1710 RepID=UPI0035D5A09E